jgi:hypothetical protein
MQTDRQKGFRIKWIKVSSMHLHKGEKKGHKGQTVFGGEKGGRGLGTRRESRKHGEERKGCREKQKTVHNSVPSCP